MSRGVYERLKLFGFSSWAIDQIMEGAVVNLYSGPVPVDADAPRTRANHLICTTYPTVERSFSGQNHATGLISFFRFEFEEPDERCIQGSTGLRNADLNFTSSAAMLGEIMTIHNFEIGVGDDARS